MPTIFKKLEKIKPVYDWTYKIMLFICKLLLIGDIIITSIVVAGRYFPFFTAPHWGEEMVLTLMVYMAVLSATLAIRKRSHIRMTAFDKYLPKKVLLALDDQAYRQYCQIRKVFLPAEPEPDLDVHSRRRCRREHDHLRDRAGVPPDRGILRIQD